MKFNTLKHGDSFVYKSCHCIKRSDEKEFNAHTVGDEKNPLSIAPSAEVEKIKEVAKAPIPSPEKEDTK